MGCIHGADMEIHAEREYVPFDPAQKCKISLKSQYDSYLYVLESGTSMWEQEGKGGVGNDHLICDPQGDHRVSIRSNHGKYLNVDNEGNIDWNSSQCTENTQILTVIAETDRHRFQTHGHRYLSILKPNLLWTNDQCSGNELFQVIVHEIYPKVEMIEVDDVEHRETAAEITVTSQNVGNLEESDNQAAND